MPDLCGLNQLAKCNNFVTLLYMELLVNPNFCKALCLSSFSLKARWPTNRQFALQLVDVSGMSSLQVLHYFTNWCPPCDLSWLFMNVSLLYHKWQLSIGRCRRNGEKLSQSEIFYMDEIFPLRHSSTSIHSSIKIDCLPSFLPSSRDPNRHISSILCDPGNNIVNVRDYYVHNQACKEFGNYQVQFFFKIKIKIKFQFIFGGQFFIVTKKNGNISIIYLIIFPYMVIFLLKEKINCLLGREILDTYQWL
jgi:thiol-disulfide isomerase/thioredoxin